MHYFAHQGVRKDENVRTTISLDPDIAAEVDRMHRQEGLGRSEAINTLARRGMAAAKAQAPYEFNPRPLRALIDLTNIAEVLDMTESGC